MISGSHQRQNAPPASQASADPDSPEPEGGRAPGDQDTLDAAPHVDPDNDPPSTPRTTMALPSSMGESMWDDLLAEGGRPGADAISPPMMMDEDDPVTLPTRPAEGLPTLDPPAIGPATPQAHGAVEDPATESTPVAGSYVDYTNPGAFQAKDTHPRRAAPPPPPVLPTEPTASGVVPPRHRSYGAPGPSGGPTGAHRSYGAPSFGPGPGAPGQGAWPPPQDPRAPGYYPAPRPVPMPGDHKKVEARSVASSRQKRKEAMASGSELLGNLAYGLAILVFLAGLGLAGAILTGRLNVNAILQPPLEEEDPVVTLPEPVATVPAWEASVSVRNAKGAVVHREGETLGPAPWTGTFDERAVVLRITSPDHRDLFRVVTPEAPAITLDGPQDAKATDVLIEASGYDDARVRIDGESAGVVPARIVVEPGMRVVELVPPGSAPLRKDVYARTASTTRVAFQR